MYPEIKVMQMDKWHRQKLALRIASQVSDITRASLGDDRSQLLFCLLTDWLTLHASDTELVDLAIEKATTEVGHVVGG